MDASQRWETEALRTGSQFRKGPPQPSAKQQPADVETRAESPDPDTNWVTLREAESATSVPLNTLRKWCRKSAIPSYLESDGEVKLRMVDLDAVIDHAHDLGREIEPVPAPQEPSTEDATSAIPPEETLLVPLDAWNKMLNQLGNLHDAGQQLAEARERAAKAETEATFLRERLAELRSQSEDSQQNEDSQQLTVDSSQSEDESPSSDGPPAVRDGRGAPATMQGDNAKPTTSYWRYLTFGWRDRKKRSSKKS